MNRATRPATFNSLRNPFNLKATLFHSTPFLERRRRTHWDSGGGAYRDSSRRFNHYSKRFGKLHSKQTLLRNASAFAEHLFQSWQHGFHEYDSSSSQGSSWFRHEFEAKSPRRSWTSTRGPYSSDRNNDDVGTNFRSAFGGNGYFYWSFVDENVSRLRSSSGYYGNYRTSWNSRYWDEEDYDSSTESENSDSDSEYRLVLGLSASGPLKLEDVKHAYRACALKWHPDRHHGSSKAIAEEKFKACSAAYQSLCDKLVLN
ncbi:hypothetical protein U1Q18_012755 [Sarracenia purpurea var. burkii]